MKKKMNIIMKQLIKTVRTGRKRYKPNKNKVHLKQYSHVVKTPIIQFEQPTYTNQNLKFNIYDLIFSNTVFQQIVENYSQFRLKKITFFAIPCLVDGHDPSPIWIYLDADGNNTQFNYANMPETQGSKLLPNKRFSMTSFSSTGRQNDFHYWYDSNQYPDANTLAIRLHCANGPKPDPDWQFQLGFVMEFRGFKAKDTNTRLVQGEQVVKLTSESQIEKEKGSNFQIENKNQIDKDNKEEDDSDECWNHIDSDVE
jgi:hypothetical protein